MYQEYYGLTEKPFNLTPDPRFLYLSKKHKEAFAHLMYGIQHRSGFVMVSGEIGTGKTTICRSLLKQLDPSIEVALVFNPYLSPEELLKHINQDFGIESDSTSVLEHIAELNEYLLKSATEGKTCVLIIDEAQNLSAEILEQIRLLSNLETEKEKLIQIMLIGQPELAEKLELHELRQLNQRITARYHLEALTEEETLHYIAFRLRVAGGRKMVRFTRKAIREVYKISQGTPRVINAICDRALLIAFTMETRELTPKIIKAAAQEIQGEGHVNRRQLNIMPVLKTTGVFCAAAVIVLMIILVTSGPFPFSQSNTASIPENTTQPPTTEHVPGSEKQVEAKSNNTQSAPSALPPKEELIVEPTPEAPEESPEKPSESPQPVTPTKAESPESTAKVEPQADSTQEPSAPATEEVKEIPSPENTEPEVTVPEEPKPTEAKPKEPKPAKEDPIKIAAIPKETTVAPTPATKAADIIPAKSDLNGLKSTLTALLAEWNVSPKDSPLKSNQANAIQQYGKSHGFNVSALNASTKQLLNINLPMLIQIKSEKGLVWAAWLKGTESSATLNLQDGTTLNLSLYGLNDIYAKRALVFWRDPFLYKSPLREKEQGEAVWVIQHHLVSIGLRNKEPNGTFDIETVSTIKQIQHWAGIDIDGILGSQTRMVLSSWINNEKVPHLMDDFPSHLPMSKNSDDETIKAAASPKALADTAADAEPAIKEDLTPTEETTQEENETKTETETKDSEEYTPLIQEESSNKSESITDPARSSVPLLPVLPEDENSEETE